MKRLSQTLAAILIATLTASATESDAPAVPTPAHHSPLMRSASMAVLPGTYASVHEPGTGVIINLTATGSDQLLSFVWKPDAKPTPLPGAEAFKLQLDETTTKENGDTQRKVILIDESAPSLKRVLRYIVTNQTAKSDPATGTPLRRDQTTYALSLTRIENEIEVIQHITFYAAEPSS